VLNWNTVFPEWGAPGCDRLFLQQCHISVRINSFIRSYERLVINLLVVHFHTNVVTPQSYSCTKKLETNSFMWDTSLWLADFVRGRSGISSVVTEKWVSGRGACHRLHIHVINPTQDVLRILKEAPPPQIGLMRESRKLAEIIMRDRNYSYYSYGTLTTVALD